MAINIPLCSDGLPKEGWLIREATWEDSCMHELYIIIIIYQQLYCELAIAMYLSVGRMLGQVIYKLRHNELKETSIASPSPDSLAGYANKV